jgi:hypothetical protein
MRYLLELIEGEGDCGEIILGEAAQKIFSTKCKAQIFSQTVYGKL